MGKYIVALYVVTTLLLSGFAKADQVGRDAILNDVGFIKDTLDFVVSGISGDGCTNHIMIAEQSGEKGEFIKFRVIESVSLSQVCIQQVTEFTKRIPTKALVLVSNLEIDPNQVYVLTVSNSPVTVEVLGKELIQ